MTWSAPDLTNLPRFLGYLGMKTAEDAQFARTLLDAGWDVRVFYGPEQMDVWQLDLLRDGWLVQFRIERGFDEGVKVVRHTDPMPGLDDYRGIGLAIFAWARHHDKPFRLSSPDDWGHDLTEYGVETLAWLAEDGGPVFDRVSGAWLAYRRARYIRPVRSASEIDAEGLAAMEAAARG